MSTPSAPDIVTGGISRAKKIRDAVQAMLVPPATTDSETLQRWAEDQSSAQDLEAMQSGDLAQRVKPDPATVDPFASDPRPALPFADDALLPTTYDAPPTTFVAEQADAIPSGWTRRLQLTQYVPALVVPADMRPRRILIRARGAGNMYVHLIRPQTYAGAADVSGLEVVSTDSPLELLTAGEVWCVSDTGTQYANVLVDYTGVEAVRTAKVLADKVGSVLASSRTPCGCNGSH